MSAELVRVAGLHKMPSLLFFSRCDNHLHPFPSQDVLGYCSCVHGGEGKGFSPPWPGCSALCPPRRADPVWCPATRSHPSPSRSPQLGTTGTLPKHPFSTALVLTAVENAGGLGQMWVNAFLPPGRPKSRSGGDGGRLVHARVGKDRKEGASFILH